MQQATKHTHVITNHFGERVEVEFAWSTLDDARAIRSMALDKRMQVLNMSRSTAQLLHVRKAERIIAWSGLDHRHDPNSPEVFSLFVEPEFRVGDLFQLLVLIPAQVLVMTGIETGYCRVSTSEGEGVLRMWLATGATQRLTTLESKPWLASCSTCNLFGNKCDDRIYLRVDIERLGAFMSRGLSDELLALAERVAKHGLRQVESV